jgi:RNA polymerase sigma-70 factor (ECF subfamily)
MEFPTVSSSNHTSTSLLHKATAKEPDAWRRLVTMYSPLVTYWCRQGGLPDSEIPDVAQDIFAAVASSLEKFQKDRPGVTFRAWMRGIARHKITDQLRRHREFAEGGTDALQRMQEVPGPEAGVELSESGDEVASLYQRALTLVRNEFEERNWMAFWRVAVENQTPAEVAAELGMTPNAVRQAKSRILRRVKEEVGDLIA